MSIENLLPFGKKKGIKSGTKKRPSRSGTGSRFRDFRGTDGQVDDADNNNRRRNQSTDSNQ